MFVHIGGLQGFVDQRLKSVRTNESSGSTRIEKKSHLFFTTNCCESPRTIRISIKEIVLVEIKVKRNRD